MTGGRQNLSDGADAFGGDGGHSCQGKRRIERNREGERKGGRLVNYLGQD